MKTYLALLSLIVQLFSSSTLATQAPDVKFVVKYDGGTLPLAHAAVDFHVVKDEMVLFQDGKRFVVPISLQPPQQATQIGV